MPGKNSGSQRNGKNKKTKKNAYNNNNGSSNDNNDFYSVVKTSSSVPSQKLPRTIAAHGIPYATVHTTTTAFPAPHHVSQEKPKGAMQSITTLINRLLTVSILIVVTYYILRGCDTTKTENGQCTAIDPIKQDFAQLFEHELYKVHVEPYADTMRAWYDQWSPEVSDQAKMLQTAAVDRATAALDRAKTIHAQTIDHAKALQTAITDQFHAYFNNNKQHPTASRHDDEHDAFDDYYSATMTPYETQLPHREIQAILTVATQARTKLDEQLRTVQRHLQKRFEEKQQQQPAMKRQREVIRSIGEEVKSDMEVLRKNAESQVIQRAKTARKAIDDENELTAIRQAERAALIEVHKSDILIDEIRLEIDHHVEANMKKWVRQAPLH